MVSPGHQANQNKSLMGRLRVTYRGLECGPNLQHHYDCLVVAVNCGSCDPDHALNNKESAMVVYYEGWYLHPGVKK
jgi:hypothetical protein